MKVVGITVLLTALLYEGLTIGLLFHPSAAPAWLPFRVFLTLSLLVYALVVWRDARRTRRIAMKYADVMVAGATVNAASMLLALILVSDGVDESGLHALMACFGALLVALGYLGDLYDETMYVVPETDS